MIAKNALYCKVTFKEDKIVGCILLGEIKEKNEILNAIEQKVDMKTLKDSILKEGFDFKRLEIDKKKSTRLIESGGLRLKVKRGGKRYFFVLLEITIQHLH